METQLITCVQDSLALYLYDNACFMGERLVAQFPSEANRYLLASCYMRNNQPSRVYHILLQGTRHMPATQYLFGVAAFHLGQLTEAAEAMRAALEGEPHLSAAAEYWLGRMAHLTDKHDDAAGHYRQCLKLNPLLWTCYREFCQLNPQAVHTTALAQLADGSSGEDYFAAGHMGAPTPEVAKASVPLGLRHTPAQLASRFPEDSTPAPAHAHVAMEGVHTPMDVSLGPAGPPPVFGGVHAAGTPSRGAFVTPSPLPGRPAGPPPLPRAPHGAGRGVRPPAADSTQPGARHKVVEDGKVRKVSGRLFTDGSVRRSTRQSHSHPSQQGGHHGTNGITEQPAAALGRSSLSDSGDVAQPSTSAEVATSGSPSAAGLAAVAALLLTIVDGFRRLCQFQCQEAIDTFRRLPTAQWNTAWVFVQVGRAYFEMVDYAKAEEAFKNARQRDAVSLEGMELYSTVLWHVRKEVELSHLAQEATKLDRLAPQTWCVMGNCFSLQREHETALKCFTRAIQLDPSFSYAYTLRGHELFANEDFDQASKSYRQAIRISSRHYNAWYGMGQIALRQEKFKMAEQHFGRALQINPGSSVLRCYMASALHKQGKTTDALAHLQQAIAADPKNPLAHFERANVLMTEGKKYPARLEEALQQLLTLKDMIPREASVHFQLGRLCKQLQRPTEALQHFHAALDLQPPVSDVNLIKSAIEKVNLPEDHDHADM